MVAGKVTISLNISEDVLKEIDKMPGFRGNNIDDLLRSVLFNEEEVKNQIKESEEYTEFLQERLKRIAKYKNKKIENISLEMKEQLKDDNIVTNRNNRYLITRFVLFKKKFGVNYSLEEYRRLLEKWG